MKLGKFISVLAVLASAAGVIYLAYKFFKKHCLVCCDGTDGCEYLDAYTEEFGDEDEYDEDDCATCCCDDCCAAAGDDEAEEEDAPAVGEDVAADDEGEDLL